MAPLISICVPTYNGSPYLEPCLDAVLSQTTSDFEVLIVDDRSSDDSLHIAERYARRDSRIMVSSNETNLGLVGNWNRCVQVARLLGRDSKVELRRLAVPFACLSHAPRIGSVLL